jgi:hypothetical protein
MNAAAQCRHLLKTYGPLLGDLNDSHRALQPPSGSKTAGWLIGHLCVTGDYGRKLCGRPPVCPAEWRALFNPGTHPATDASAYPAMSEMVTRFREVYEDLANAFESAPAEVLQKKNPFVPGRTGFPNSSDFAAYLMTGHLAYHLGQLSGWRDAALNRR